MGQDQIKNSMLFGTAGSSRLAITSAGKVGVGTISPVGKLTVDENNASEHFQLRNTTNTSNFTAFGVDTSFNLRVYTNGSNERVRIDSSGNFLVGRTNTITIAGDPSNACFEQLTDNGMPLTVHCAQTNKRGLGIFYTSGGSASDFIRCQIDNSAKFLVTGNGNAQNANNSYGSISDVSLKENIVDANSQWDDIKNIRVRNYNFKESTGQPTHTQIGVELHKN